MNEERPVAIRVSGVKKRYRLGMIGGGTLQADLQSWWARIHGREDPNTPIGQEQRLVGQTFMALNGIDLTIHQGEAVGIIGANGAGKSTLLKLLCRVTAPTEGEIDLYGRITSMLEVGTGFNNEMTGRDNIYMNGAILGMTKAEIDAKIEDIIDFSEVRDFIDTPVKRYSSGMRVKLGFSVAAHLDSEIMIMDEVLAVGDMAFQKKCLTKMREAAKKDGRTVLYVSHNMNTIRTLCDRCIVLDQGKLVFDGDVDEAIGIYMDSKSNNLTYIDYTDKADAAWLKNPSLRLRYIEFAGKEANVYAADEAMRLNIQWRMERAITDLCLRIEVYSRDEIPQATYFLFGFYSGSAGEIVTAEVELDISNLAEAQYQLKFTFFEKDEYGNNINVGFGRDVYFEKSNLNDKEKLVWDARAWGYVKQPTPSVISIVTE